MNIRYKSVGFNSKTDYQISFESEMKKIEKELESEFERRLTKARDKSYIRLELLAVLLEYFHGKAKQANSTYGSKILKRFYINQELRGESINLTLQEIDAVAKEDIHDEPLAFDQEGQLRPESSWVQDSLVSNRIKELAKILAHYHFLVERLTAEDEMLMMKFYEAAIYSGVSQQHIDKALRKKFATSNPDHSRDKPEMSNDNILNQLSSTPSSKSQVEGKSSTQAQRALAIRILLNVLGAKNTDHSAYARFMQFLGGGSADAVRRYFSPSREEERSASTRIKDLKAVKQIFDEVGLEELCSAIQEDIEKLE